GNFRKNHPAIGAGIHQEISASPYVFSRTFTQDTFADKVVIGLDLPKGPKEISVGTVFENGTKLKDGYSGKKVVVSNGKINIDSEFDIVLLEKQ
ncbi:MAG TPA: alpha-amylase, partial [Flavobacterium sp.]|nr:alpha-amylase [Flavobacterium sp.]